MDRLRRETLVQLRVSQRVKLWNGAPANGTPSQCLGWIDAIQHDDWGKA